MKLPILANYIHDRFPFRRLFLIVYWEGVYVNLAYRARFSFGALGTRWGLYVFYRKKVFA